MEKKLFKKYIFSNENSVVLGTLIRTHRVEQNLSTDALARYSGVSRSYLSQIERGLRTASLEKYLAIFNELDIQFEVVDLDLLKKKFDKVITLINSVELVEASKIIKELENSKSNFTNSNGFMEYVLIRFIYNVVNEKGKWSKKTLDLEKVLDSISKVIPDDYKILFSQYKGVKLYYDKDYKSSIDLLLRAKNYGISRHVVMINYHLGLVYTVHKKPVQAILACISSLSGFEKTMNFHRIISTKLHLGINYSILGDTEEVLKYFNEVIALSLKFNESKYLPPVYGNLAFHSLSNGDYNDVFMYIQKGNINKQMPWEYVYCGILAASKLESYTIMSKWISLGESDIYKNIQPIKNLIRLFSLLRSEGSTVDLIECYKETLKSIKTSFYNIAYESVALMYIDLLESKRMYKEALNFQQELFWTMKGKKKW